MQHGKIRSTGVDQSDQIAYQNEALAGPWHIELGYYNSNYIF